MISETDAVERATNVTHGVWVTCSDGYANWLCHRRRVWCGTLEDAEKAAADGREKYPDAKYDPRPIDPAAVMYRTVWRPTKRKQSRRCTQCATRKGMSVRDGLCALLSRRRHEAAKGTP